MGEVLLDLSEPALAAAVEENLFGLFSQFRHCRQAEMHDDADRLWTIIVDIPFPLFNSILRAQLTPDGLDAAIEAAIKPYKAKNLPALWWTGPATQPADLGARLVAHGLTYEGDSPGMAVKLEGLREDQPRPQDLVIETVTDDETLRTWCHTNIVGFEWPDFLHNGLFNLYADLGREEVPLTNYIGRLNGEPAATSTLFLAAGVAGIYNVATVPDARRKGIGAAMTLKPLLDARAMGYRSGILQSSEMGLTVYRKLGFRQVCNLGNYVLE